VEIDDAALEGGEEGGFDDAHETGEHDEVGLPRTDLGDVALLGVAFEFGFERGGVEVDGGDAETRAEFEDAGGGLVAQNAGDAGATQPAGAFGGEDSFGIAAATRAEEDDFKRGIHRWHRLSSVLKPEFYRKDAKSAKKKGGRILPQKTQWNLKTWLRTNLVVKVEGIADGMDKRLHSGAVVH